MQKSWFNQRSDILNCKSDIENWYWQNGLKLEEVAERLLCSRQLLAKYMDKLGIPRRTSKEAMTLRMKQLGRERGPNWQGGRWESGNKIFVYAPNHPKARHNGCVPEHVIVAEQKYGRLPTSKELVHHRDGDSLNNEPSNIKIAKRNAHNVLHRVVVCIRSGELELRDVEVLLNEGN